MLGSIIKPKKIKKEKNSIGGDYYMWLWLYLMGDVECVASIGLKYGY